jgi:hypothetical protein
VDGALLKLTIIPFEDVAGGIGPPAGPPFIVQFNPETYTDTTEFKVGPDAPAQGEVGGEAKFQGVNPKKFSFELMLDGTGVSPAPLCRRAAFRWSRRSNCSSSRSASAATSTGRAS